LSYPVTFQADYIEQRSRLTTFFRFILAIPVLIWISIYGIFVSVGVIIAWLAIVITGRYPEALYRFVAGGVRLFTRGLAYVALLCDAYPPFTPEDAPDYPIRMHFDGPLLRYSRLKTLFRFILAIPIIILRYVINLLLEVAAFAAWFVILVLGRMPRGLFDTMILANSYVARSDAYLFLLTETYPPFQDETTRGAGVGD
jgi:Domain of unknown function (DUF4389)